MMDKLVDQIRRGDRRSLARAMTLVDGVDPEAAALKGYESPVAGAADVLLFPDLESANMAAKSVEYVASLEPAHCILGARAPILIPSRSETAVARLSSIAFGALLSV